MTELGSLTPDQRQIGRKPSYHYFDSSTGKQATFITNLLPDECLTSVLEAAKYAAENIRVVWCWQCADTGILAETWGPNEGCAEFMTEPETQFCDCDEGFMAKEADYDRRETERLMQEEHDEAQKITFGSQR